jgi:hypothetical protein
VGRAGRVACSTSAARSISPVTTREAVRPRSRTPATAMNRVRRTTGTRAMKRYETMSFVRMRQRRRFENQR